MPYLNKPIKAASWRRFIPWFADSYHGHSDAYTNNNKYIESHPAPLKVRPDGRTIEFVDGSTFEADTIVYATGYRQTFPFLHEDARCRKAAQQRPESPATQQEPHEQIAPQPSQAKRVVGGGGGGGGGGRRPATSPMPSRRSNAAATAAASDVGGGGGDGGDGGGWVPCTGARGAEDPLPSEHFIVSPDEPTLSFIGFVRPNVGAIPPMSEMQVMWWIQRLKGKVTTGTNKPPTYGLLGRKLNYGVDYGNYMHQLAAGMKQASSQAKPQATSKSQAKPSHSPSRATLTHIPSSPLPSPLPTC